MTAVVTATGGFGGIGPGGSASIGTTVLSSSATNATVNLRAQAVGGDGGKPYGAIVLDNVADGFVGSGGTLLLSQSSKTGQGGGDATSLLTRSKAVVLNRVTTSAMAGGNYGAGTPEPVTPGSNATARAEADIP